MALHEKDILHEDLEPGSIFVDSNGNLKLSDFGVSKQFPDSMSYTGAAKGTYSNPEVLKGEEYDFSADIWSLDYIFHELCCFEPPCTEKNTYIFIKW